MKIGNDSRSVPGDPVADGADGGTGRHGRPEDGRGSRPEERRGFLSAMEAELRRAGRESRPEDYLEAERSWLRRGRVPFLDCALATGSFDDLPPGSSRPPFSCRRRQPTDPPAAAPWRRRTSAPPGDTAARVLSAIPLFADVTDEARNRTMRSFNTTGPVNPADHYCIPPLRLLRRRGPEAAGEVSAEPGRERGERNQSAERCLAHGHFLKSHGRTPAVRCKGKPRAGGRRDGAARQEHARRRVFLERGGEPGLKPGSVASHDLDP